MDNETPEQRLGRLVRERRKSLKMTQADVQEAGGPSTATLRLIEGGKNTDFRGSTGTDLENALNWMHGSIDDVLAGYEPTDVGQPKSEGRGLGSFQVDLTAIPGDALLEELRRRIRSDVDYLSSKPVRRWTGLIQLVETEGDVDVVDDSPESGAPGQTGQTQEVSLDQSESQRLRRELDALTELEVDRRGDGAGEVS